jgi:hypothetical protein
MSVAQGRYWRVTLSRKREGALFSLSELPEELAELSSFKLEVPFGRWNAVIRQAESDRKLLGGILLDLADTKDLVARVIASDRLFGELQRVLRDATVALVEAGALVIGPASAERKED